MDEHNRHPALSRRQVALFERNPVCRLCYDICLDMAEDYGGVRFDLLQSLEVADDLCERILLNPWDLLGFDQYYHWVEGRLSYSRPAIACAFSTVCVTLHCIDDLPAPVKTLARDLSGLIVGEANNLYDELSSAAYRQSVSIAADTYGDIPPMPEQQRELLELQYAYSQATTEIQTLKKQLQMKEQQDDQKAVYQFYGRYIKENHVEAGGNQILSAENVYLPGAEKVSIGTASSSSVSPESNSETDSTSPSQSVSAESILGIPAERDYKAVRIYIEERSRFDPGFKTFCDANSRVTICERLSKEFGWTVDPYGLGRNINRKRKKKA